MQTNTSFMVRPEKVVRGVLRAIDNGTADILVMKGPGRLLIVLTDLFPSLGNRSNKVSGAQDYMHRVADFRERANATAAGGPDDLVA